MTTIKKLKLKLKSGLLSEVQSDTIFGHFAWRFKEYHNDEKLLDFLNLFVDGLPVFTISDGMFEKRIWDREREKIIEEKIYFPKPLKLSPAKFDSKNKKERIINFIKQKESKSRKLVTLQELNFYLNGELEKFEKSLEIPLKNTPKFVEDLRVSVEIDRQTFQSKEEQLFTYHPKYLDDDTFIDIFIKVIDKNKWNEFECEKIFKSVFEIGFGKKKSSGYGQFKIIDFDNFDGFSESADANGFVSLSHYMPANKDKITDAYYDINVKYGKFGEEKSNSHNPFKPPMLLMKPGSCFLTNESKDFYGRVIKGINAYQPKTIHNCIAFSLNCKF
ncbi:MAG: hypothetical protein ACE5ES_04780 [Candidatus Nanoarchaeia archaeon]